MMRNSISFLLLIVRSAFALQCEVAGECMIMVIGGFSNGSYLDDVELVSIDPISHPVPDCLSQLNPLPELTGGSAGALDYLGKSP